MNIKYSQKQENLSLMARILTISPNIYALHFLSPYIQSKYGKNRVERHSISLGNSIYRNPRVWLTSTWKECLEQQEEEILFFEPGRQEITTGGQLLETIISIIFTTDWKVGDYVGDEEELGVWHSPPIPYSSHSFK